MADSGGPVGEAPVVSGNPNPWTPHPKPQTTNPKQDMAILTGAQLISEDLGLKLDKVLLLKSPRNVLKVSRKTF